MNFLDLQKNLPNGNNSGSIEKIYFGLHADVDGWPSKPDNPVDIDENGVLTGDLTMKAGKRLFEMYATEDTAGLSINDLGEMDGMGFDVVLDLFHPGLQKKLLGFINGAKNEDLVFIVQDADGNKFLMGDQYRPAKRRPAEGGGTQSTFEGRKGLNLQFGYKTNSVYSYTGNVPLTTASV